MTDQVDSSPAVGFTILTHQRPSLATETLKRLVARERVDSSAVTLVINGDGGLSDAELYSPRTVRLDSNLGPAGGMACALDLAIEDNLDWVLLCEDDASDALDASAPIATILEEISKLGEDANVGAVVSYGRAMDWHTGRTVPDIPDGSETGLRRTDVAAWGATLVNVEAVRAGARPDPSWFFGFEDFDFFLELRRLGYATMMDTDCARSLGRSVHPSGRRESYRGRRAVDDAEPWRRYYEARNFVLLARKHGLRRWQADHVVASFKRCRHGGFGHWRAIVRGLWDGARGRSGRNDRYLRDPQGST